MGAAGSHVRSRPSPDMVTACCIARKGNFRTGPSLSGKMELMRLPQALEGLEETSSDDERRFSLPRRRMKVTWRDRFLEDRYEIPESGDEWRDARKSEDINFSELPEVGVARKMTFNKEAMSSTSARQRAARKKGKDREHLLPKEGAVEGTD